VTAPSAAVTGQTGTGLSGSVVLTAYETWAQQYGGGDVLGSPSDDPDHDGVANLVEYALGTTPNSAGSPPEVLAEMADNRLRLKFTPQVVSGISYFVQSSSDLVEWNDVIIPESSLAAGVPYTFTDTLDVPAGILPQRFLRLRVEAP